jgi:hypothetical protein
MTHRQQLTAAGIIIFLSRLPFLFYGYGAEEDAWALRLVAERITATGEYEVSRLPGHPVQELFYALIWKTGSLGFNLVTALLSTGGILAFMHALRKLNVKNWLLSGFFLAAVPVVYINSTNAMDYTWAMAFILFSFAGLVSGNRYTAGLFLALAVGCRITSGAFWIPFSWFLWHISENRKATALTKFTVSTLGFTLLFFIPVFSNYGFSFFTFYEHFPLPDFLKNAYKGIIAVWGLPLLVLVPVIIFLQVRSERITNSTQHEKLLVHVSLISIALTVIAFLRVPLKSAFMIPLVPFVAILAALFFDEKRMRLLVMTALASSFLFGLNLDDQLRGSVKSSAAISFEAGNQHVALDPLQGLVTADLTKRLQRTNYAREVLQVVQSVKKPAAVIAGWWLADVLVLQGDRNLEDVQWLYYTSEVKLRQLINEGWTIYYLPEQEEFNDLRFRKEFTRSLAKPFPSLP